MEWHIALERLHKLPKFWERAYPTNNRRKVMIRTMKFSCIIAISLDTNILGSVYVQPHINGVGREDGMGVALENFMDNNSLGECISFETHLKE